MKSEILKELTKDLKHIFKDTGAMLAGGCILSCLQKENGIESKFNDLDFFFENENSYREAKARLEKEIQKAEQKDSYSATKNIFFGASLEVYKEMETEWACTYWYKGKQIQLIKKFMLHKDQLKLFDIQNAKVYSFYPFEEIKGSTDIELLSDLKIQRTLNFKLIERMFKYRERKSISISSYYPEIYQFFLKYPEYTEEDLKDDHYNKVPEIDKNSKLDYKISLVLMKGLIIDDFREYIAEREEQYKEMLPYRTLRIDWKSPYMDALSQKAPIKALSYYIDQAYNREPNRGIEFISEYYPEELL